MAQWVKTLATKSDNLEFYPQTYVVGENQLLQVVLLSVHTYTQFKKRIQTNLQKDSCLHTGLRILVRLLCLGRGCCSPGSRPLSCTYV